MIIILQYKDYKMNIGLKNVISETGFDICCSHYIYDPSLNFSPSEGRVLELV